MAKLSAEDVMAAKVLVDRGRSIRSMARDLGVDESTLGYRLKRLREGAVDSRRNQPEAWHREQLSLAPLPESLPIPFDTEVVQAVSDDGLDFEFASPVIAELIERAVREEMSLDRFLELLLVTERDSREARRVKTALRLSGLPAGKTLEEFDFLFQPGVDRAKIEMLATCEFARRRENVLLLGPPGVGKTHLAAEHPRVARHARRRRGAGHGDPRSPPAPLPRGADRREKLPAPPARLEGLDDG